MKKLFILLLLGSKICYSQNINQNSPEYINQAYATKIENAGTIIKQLLVDKHIPGLTVCVAVKNNIVWAQAYGYADLENATPVKLNTKFRVGSISKTLTALGLCKLVEEGKIRLSDTVTRLVNYFPEKKSPITIAELTAHTAGIRDYNYRKNEFMSDTHFNSVEESIGMFKDDTLLFTPGTKYKYSTFGYVLLSAAIEKAAKKDFLTFMHDDIFVPIGLENTVADQNKELILNRSRFYDEVKGKLSNGIYVDNSNKWAGGGFLSTSYDLTKMVQSLFEHKFLNKESVDKLWTSYLLPDGKPVDYGIGWKLAADTHSRKYVYHGGSSMGGRSIIFVYPDTQTIVAITCNLSTDFDQGVAIKIAEVFEGK
jgi:CubicO group peptidase (beta-lactamase class C family)